MMFYRQSTLPGRRVVPLCCCCWSCTRGTNGIAVHIALQAQYWLLTTKQRHSIYAS